MCISTITKTLQTVLTVLFLLELIRKKTHPVNGTISGNMQTFGFSPKQQQLFSVGNKVQLLKQA